MYSFFLMSFMWKCPFGRWMAEMWIEPENVNSWIHRHVFSFLFPLCKTVHFDQFWPNSGFDSKIGILSFFFGGLHYKLLIAFWNHSWPAAGPRIGTCFHIVEIIGAIYCRVFWCCFAPIRSMFKLGRMHPGPWRVRSSMRGTQCRKEERLRRCNCHDSWTCRLKSA